MPSMHVSLYCWQTEFRILPKDGPTTAKLHLKCLGLQLMEQEYDAEHGCCPSFADSQFKASTEEGPAGFCEARLEVAGLIDGARVYTMPSTHV